MKLAVTARKILAERYLDEGETPEDMVKRVAHAVAQAEHEEDREEWEEKFTEVMDSLDFLPNSPTLMNAGRGFQQLSACFVLPVEDSMHGIFTALYNMAMIQKSGGGTGFSFSQLRPKGASVSSTRGESSGPISFLKVFNAASEEIEQGGTRRGANMGCMSVYHPDILDFIRCKDTEGELANFNISVLVDKEFMDAVAAQEYITLEHPSQPTFQNTVIRADQIMDAIVEQCWKNGEPGIIFIDKMNAANPVKHLGQIESTNPCGEQPLLPFESCNLGSINLANMIKSKGPGDRRYGNGTHIVDWAKLADTVHIAVRFLDNVIDINKYALPEIQEHTLKTRKIGLGVMGWATLLIKLGIPYDSVEALKLAEEVMCHMDTCAAKASHVLSVDRGVYPALQLDQTTGRTYRNATRTTIAPTGTLATIAGVSYGIEPIFGLTYTKKMVDQTFVEVNPDFLEYLQQHITDPAQRADIIEEVKKKGSCRHIQEHYRIPKSIRNIFKCASEIHYKDHIQMQAAFQKYTDNAVSKTINMPHDAKNEDIKEVYRYAFENGCKGVTIYREGSRMEEAVSIGTKEEVPSETKDLVDERPQRLTGFTEYVYTGCGKLYVTINNTEQGVPIETFVATGSDGGCEAFSIGLSRVISYALRKGVDPEGIIKQLRKVTCKNFLRRTGECRLEGKSCPDVIGRVLEGALKNVPEITFDEYDFSVSYFWLCPGCGDGLKAAEGCWVCEACGYNECV